jgi:hypothetical protein
MTQPRIFTIHLRIQHVSSEERVVRPVNYRAPMTSRVELEELFIVEILRIVGPKADRDAYAVSPDTSDALLVQRVDRLRELPSAIGHDALLGLVAPRDAE